MTPPWLDSLLSARVYDLEQPRFHGMPIHPTHKPGYFYSLHRRHELPRHLPSPVPERDGQPGPAAHLHAGELSRVQRHRHVTPAWAHGPWTSQLALPSFFRIAVT